MDERSKDTSPSAPAGQHAAPVERRPYERPEVASFPLFERMALTCDPGLKGTGSDDQS